MRVLVSGWRSADVEKTWPVLLAALRACDTTTGKHLTIIHGDAPGVDQAATRVAEMLGANLYRFPAEWDYYGQQGPRYRKAAGRLRNAEMLTTMPPDIVVALPGPTSKGTWDMVNLATKRGVRVYSVMLGEEHAPDVRDRRTRRGQERAARRTDRGLASQGG